MLLTVGETQLTVNNAFAYRYGNGKLVLKIEVSQTEISHDDLKALLKNNTGDIVKTDGDKTETYSGFSYTLTILDRDDVYECEVECISETERKVGDLQNTIIAQEGIISELREANDDLLNGLLEMSELVYSESEVE